MKINENNINEFVGDNLKKYFFTDSLDKILYPLEQQAILKRLHDKGVYDYSFVNNQVGGTTGTLIDLRFTKIKLKRNDFDDLYLNEKKLISEERFVYDGENIVQIRLNTLFTNLYALLHHIEIELDEINYLLNQMEQGKNTLDVLSKEKLHKRHNKLSKLIGNWHFINEIIEVVEDNR